jgi:two-component system NtrC family sensor kinase
MGAGHRSRPLVGGGSNTRREREILMWRLVPFHSLPVGSASVWEWEWLVSWLVSLLLMAVAIFALIAAALMYIRQLNRCHARLLTSLEIELAERQKIEEALRASEGFYHSLVESLPQSILRKDRDGRFTFGNGKFCAALDRPLEQVVGKTDFDFYPTELAKKYRCDDRKVMESKGIFETIEEHITPHGERLYVHVIKTPLLDPLGDVIGVQGIFWDVTERKQAEEQLVRQNIRLQAMAECERLALAALKQAQSRMVQSEKLASLGQMVAGVAHEINNPVAFVTNNVAVLGRDLGEIRELLALYEEADDLIARERPNLAARIGRHRERVDMAYTLQNIDGLLLRSREGLKRIQQIITHLRLFAHLDEGEIIETNLNDGIESTAAIVLGHARKKQVRLDLDLRPLPHMTCYAAKINQVILSLMSNAIDASNEGGTVTVRTRVEASGESVRMEVADDGVGIDPAICDRIFDPFFTTKPVGQGTGLGLSISYVVVQEQGGTIEVESTPGRGSCFLVHLPVHLADPPHLRRPADPQLAADGVAAHSSSPTPG